MIVTYPDNVTEEQMREALVESSPELFIIILAFGLIIGIVVLSFMYFLGRRLNGG